MKIFLSASGIQVSRRMVKSIWTSFSGSVPDCDDTPGVILALLMLQPKEKVKEEVFAACQWLVMLQSNDGG